MSQAKHRISNHTHTARVLSVGISLVVASVLALTTYQPAKAATDCSDVFTPLSAYVMSGVNTNKSFYVQIMNETGVPWELLAAIHYRETNFSHTNPANGQGIFQFVNGAGGPYPAGQVTDDEFVRQLKFMAMRLQDDYVWRGSVPREKRQLKPDEYNVTLVKDTLYSYNGRAGVYASQAASYGYDSTTQPYEGSPYVMNRFDCPRARMGIITRDYGSMDGIDARYGAFTVFARLRGDAYWKSLIGTTGLLIRTPASPEVYYTMGIQKYRAGSMSMAAEYGLGVSDVRVVEQTEFDSIPLASGSNTSDLTLAVKSNSDSDSDGGNIYLIAGGKRYLITSMGLLSEYGFTVDQIGYLPLLELERMPLTANLSTFAQSPNGFLYRVEGGVNKRGIFQMEVFNSVNPSGAFTPLSDFILSRYSTTTALIGVPIVMQSSDGKIWYARSSGWHYIPSMQEYKCLGLNNIEPLRFTSAQTQVGSILTPATCLLRHSSGSTFIANGSSKLPIQNAWLPINTTSLGDEILNTKSAGAITQSSVFKSDNGALYTLGGGTKRHIMNVAVLDELGVSLGSVVDVRGGAIADIQNDIPRFATRTVIQDETNGKLYFMAKDVLYYIPTMRVFSDFGLSTESIVKMQPSNIAKFTAGGELSRVARLTSGGGAVMDKGKTFIVPDALLGDFGITGATPQYPREVITSNQVTATKFIKSSTSAQLYMLSGGTKRAVATWSLFVSLGGSQSNITSMSSQAVDTIPSGPNM